MSRRCKTPWKWRAPKYCIQWSWNDLRLLSRNAPQHGSREILMLWASLTSQDPGDVLQSLGRLKENRIRCSIIGLTAEVHICKDIVKETSGAAPHLPLPFLSMKFVLMRNADLRLSLGIYRVALHEEHYKELMWDFSAPPPSTLNTSIPKMVQMGFPHRYNLLSPSLCVCHQECKFDGLMCPRCDSKICHIPSDCPICGLMLISSPHLARSYHHLFPVPLYSETPPTIPMNEKLPHSTDSASLRGTFCFGCQLDFNPHSVRSKCDLCNQLFCSDCDNFVHEVLHNCPGCFSKAP